MRKLFVFALISIVSVSLFAQKTYFDLDWNEVEESEAAYYRITEKEGSNETYHYAEDYYISGKLQWKGYMSSCEPQTLEGHHTYWYENGHKEADGHYENGKLNGLARYWYGNGQLKWKSNYKNGQRNGKHLEWYVNGKKKAKVEYAMGKVVHAKYWTEGGKRIEQKEDIKYWEEDYLEEIEQAE